MTRTVTAFLCATLALAACGDAGGPSSDGTLSVEVSGHIVDRFEAAGSWPDSGFPTGTFAAARAGAVPGTLAILAERVEGGASDAIVLELTGYDGPGSHPARGVVQYGALVFEIVDGEVEITDGSGARVRGTFDGVATTALQFPGQGVPPDTVRLSDGVFDVPIVVPTQ